MADDTVDKTARSDIKDLQSKLRSLEKRVKKIEGRLDDAKKVFDKAKNRIEIVLRQLRQVTGFKF